MDLEFFCKFSFRKLFANFFVQKNHSIFWKCFASPEIEIWDIDQKFEAMW
jgi:hypothetical protein